MSDPNDPKGRYDYTRQPSYVQDKNNNDDEIISWVLVGLAIAAFGTSIVECIKEETYGLLFMVVTFFPIGIVHGVMVWFQ